MLKMYAFAITAIATLWLMTTPTNATAGCCDLGVPVCNDPGFTVCAETGTPPIILCQGDSYDDVFYAYTDTSGDACVYGTIDDAFGTPTQFCCDDTDMPNLLKLRIIADAGDDFIDLYPSSQNWQEDGDLYGGSGDDTLYGSNYTTGGTYDTIHGGTDDDYLNGRDGDDVLLGDGGVDEHRGGDGDDYLKGDGALDTFYGEDDDDILCTRDGVTETVIEAGGGGADECYMDGPETSNNCDGNDYWSACPAP